MIRFLSEPGSTPQYVWEQWSLNNMQKSILNTMSLSQSDYVYDSPEQLKFEIKLRNQIVKAARGLSASGAAFATFSKSKCNEQFWNLEDDGGFRLKNDRNSAEAINDIFKQGWKYAFECGTATVVIYYKAVMQSIGQDNFNQLFSGLWLYDWHYDPDLGLTWQQEPDYFPGDVQYFVNPDYNPRTPEWQGENVVLMDNNHYFGHGIGIKSEAEMIKELNHYRKPGAKVPASLLDKASRPDYKTLSRYEYAASGAVRSRIGSIQQVHP